MPSSVNRCRTVRRLRLSAILTAVTLLLAAGGAQAQNVADVTAPNGLYKVGDVIPITIIFDQTVVVAGTPELRLRVESDVAMRVTTAAALYTAGSNSAMLTFDFTVEAGDSSDNVVYNGTSALRLPTPTVTIQSTGGANVGLILPSILDNSISDTSDPVIVDGIVPTTSATITSVIETVGGAALTSGGSTLLTSIMLSGGFDSVPLPMGEVVNIYDGSELLGQATLASDLNSWTMTDTSLVTGDAPSYTAVVADPAGNEGMASAAFTLYIGPLTEIILRITPDSARENIPEGSFMITAAFPVGVTRTTNTIVPFRARGIGENPAAINHDYSHREGFSIVILANSPSGTIPSGGSPFVFVLVNDAISEPDETVEFYSPDPPVGFTVTPATLTIEDDDASTNADLVSLSLTDPDAGGAAIPLAETFDPAVGTYTATVVNSVTNVTVTPTVDSGATTVLLVGGSPVTNPIALSVGDTAITVRVTAEDTATIKNYLITVTRAAPVNVPATGVPTITGTASSGETLTAATTDIMDDNGLGTFSYLWQQGTDDGADGGYINIASATTETLVLTDTQVGRRILVIVSFTDNDGNAETVTSVATAAVAAVALQGPMVTSVTATAGTYGLGEVVAITVTFNGETIVDGPGPSLSMSTGGTATYLPGSSLPTTLAFGYTVRSNDDTDAFSYAGTAALTLNVGGEILNFAEDADAILTLPTPVAFADVIVDGIAPPAPTFVPSPTFVKVNTPLGGVTEDGTTVILCLVGGSGDSCGPSGEGRMARTHDLGGLTLIAFGATWSYTLTQADITAMGEGLETLIAIATDVAGNTAEGAVEVTVDTTAPAIPTFTDPTAVAGDDNIINADEGATGLTLTGGTAADVDAVHICFNGTPDFAPTGSPGCDGGGTRTAAQDTNTTWSYDLSAIRITEFLGSGVLTEGSTSTMIIIATDAAGNRAMSASVTISTDTTLPTVTADITSVTETGSGATVTSGGTTAATSLTLSGMGDTTDLMVNIHDGTDLLGSVMAAADGGWSYTDASLTPGTTRNYTAAVADTAGNEGPASGIFTITSTAAVVPIVTSVAAPNGSYKAGDLVPITVTFSEAVTVGIAGGVPELMLTTDTSGGTGVATYTAGTDTDELTFTYTVRTRR